MLLKRAFVVAVVLVCPALLAAQDPSALTLGPSVRAMSSPEKSAIVEVLDRYFKGNATIDPDLVSSTVHPEAVMTGGVGQPSVTIMQVAQQIEGLRKMRARGNPPVINSERSVTDLFVRGSLATAFVRQKYLPPTRGAGIAIDHCLLLSHTGGRWTVVSAVVHAGQYEGDTDAKTLDAMGVRPGMTIGEIGAGSGRVTFALARRVGDRGKVYANDIDAQALAELRGVCQRRGVKNIETLVGKVDDPLFPKAALDLAIIAIAYHHLEQPVVLLKNLAPSLKPGASFVILDPAYDRTGDKDSDRPTTRERVESEAAQAGYELVAIDASLPRENIFILRLKEGGAPVTPKINTTPWSPSSADERGAIVAAVDTWWKGHDTDDAVIFEGVMAPGTRSWFEHEGGLQNIPYAKEIERIRSGNRRAGRRPLPGETRTVADFAQRSAVAMVTMLVEIPRAGGPASRTYVTFQLYKADDRWLVVNMADTKG
jgi:SAM-dependent methyltransferase